MPVVFRYWGFTFFFYSNEETPREPVHVHVEKDNLEAKFWMNPEYAWPTKPGSRGHGMNSSVSATRVHFDAD